MSAFRSIKHSPVVERARAALPHERRRSSVYNNHSNGNRASRNGLSIRPLRLPAELWVEIFSTLTPEDITNLQLASRNFRLLISFNQEGIAKGILSNTPELDQLSQWFPRLRKNKDEGGGLVKKHGGVKDGGADTPPPLPPRPERRDTGSPPLHKLYHIQYLHGLTRHRQICRDVAWYLAQRHINQTIPTNASPITKAQRTEITKSFQAFLTPRLFALHAFLTHLQLRLNFLLASQALSTYNPSSSLCLPPDCSLTIQRDLLQSPGFTTAELVKTHHIYVFLLNALHASITSPNLVQTEKYIFAILSHRAGLQGVLDFFTADDMVNTKERSVRAKYMKEMGKKLEKVEDGTRSSQVWLSEAAKEMNNRGVGNGFGVHAREVGWLHTGGIGEWHPICEWCMPL